MLLTPIAMLALGTANAGGPALAPELPVGLASTGLSPAVQNLYRAAPENSVLVLSANSMADMRSKFDANALGKFFADPEMKKVCSYFEDQGLSMEALMEKSELPIDPFAMLNSIQDSMVFFMSPIGEGLQPAFGLLITPGADNAAFEGYCDQLCEIMDQELEGSSESYESVEFTHYMKSENEPDLAYFEHNGVVALLGSEGRENLLNLTHGVLDRMAGRDDSLGVSGSDPLNNARRSVKGKGDAEAFLDVASLMQLIDTHEDEDEYSDDIKSIMDDVGLTRMRWFYGNMSIGEGENLDVNMSFHIPAESHIASFMDHFGSPPTHLGKYLPAASTSFSLGNYDVFGAWETGLDILEQYSPEARTQVDSGLQMVSSTFGLDVIDDFMANIDGDFAGFYTIVPQEEIDAKMSALAGMGIEMEGLDQGNAMIVGLKNPDVVELFLEDALALAEAQAPFLAIEQEDFQDFVINRIDIPEAGSSFMWSFTEDGLVFSEYPSAIRAALSNASSEDAQTALGSERYQARLRGNMKGSSMVSVSDTVEMWRMMIGAAGMLTSMADMFDLDEMPADIDLSEIPIPDPELARKYFKGTILSTMVRSEDALVMRMSGR